MAHDYVEWLAIQVLNEEQLVTYRTLSRALKVHNNLAKQMLFDFHRKQNAKRPGSVHATYLISGVKHAQSVKTNGHSQQDGGDAVMQSSPPLPSSSMPKQDEDSADKADHVEVHTVMLARQEHFEQAKATFESITDIHVYSLQANGLSDMQSLTECNRKIAVDYASEDPLQQWKQYGIIQNPHVKRRTQRRPPPPPPAPIAKETAKPKPASVVKQESKDSQDDKAPSRPQSAQATSDIAKKPASKRQNSDIFKSFAKSRTKEVKSESRGSAAPSLGEGEDANMGGFSDEDEEDIDDKNDVVEKVPKVPDGKSKKEREAELQAMMDQEDEMMEDAADAMSVDHEAAEEDNTIDKASPKVEEEPKESVTVENGRRRGRRRVMKKITEKDADGYLVTREEPAWESFSEEEPALKKIKAPPAISTNKPAAGKKGGKPGQGNIMSFFGKK